MQRLPERRRFYTKINALIFSTLLSQFKSKTKMFSPLKVGQNIFCITTVMVGS